MADVMVVRKAHDKHCKGNCDQCTNKVKYLSDYTQRTHCFCSGKKFEEKKGGA